MKKLLAHPKALFGFATIVLLLAIGSVGLIGYDLGTKHPKTLVIKGVNNIETDPTVTADFSTFWQAWKVIKDEYLKGDEVKEKSLVYGAIDGIVKSLGDPNTNFFPPVEAKQFQENVSGHFGGIGAEIGLKNDELVVIAPLKDSPAEKAGLRSEDKIIKIDGEGTLNIKVSDAVNKIRGEIGTTVVLTILRGDLEKPQDISIIRNTINIPTIDSKMLEGNIGYIRIKSFNENAPQLFFAASKELVQEGLNGMIIDLRDDPGGYLEVAVNIAGWFFNRGETVAIQEFRGGKQQQFNSYGNGIYKTIPVVVLINGGSASASEILAGALRDNNGAQLVGEKTFGKGTVQELKPLKDGSNLKLTIAHWLTPKGTLIDKEGIKPDVEVKLSDDDIKSRKDPQLEKAQAVIAELVKKALAKS